ncbi:hypothetical protein QE431_000942 [Flavobacterium sp. SORGH_AS 622]|nr:hypothetical protein [Flavobacterium sp. SORGH_AS_0622]
MPAITKAEDIEIDYIQQQSHGKFFDDYVPKKYISVPTRR